MYELTTIIDPHAEAGLLGEYGLGVGDQQEDIRLTFDRVPIIYDRVRPTYPAELFDQLFVALPESAQIVEVGPGTGQATGDLLRRGAQVTALELGEHLADFLEKKFGREPGLRVLNRSFEDAELAHHHFDAVVCATAYHWIPPHAQVNRPLELLRPGGSLGIIDLIQVDSDIDRGYFARVQPIYDSFDKGRATADPQTHTTVHPRIATHLKASSRFSSVEVYRVRWDQTYSSAQYRDLLTTYSGTQMMAEPERSQMVNQLIAVIDDEFDGVVTRPLVAALTLATV